MPDLGPCSLERHTTVTVYLRNVGTRALTLSVVVDNWSPTYAASRFILYASCDGHTLEPTEVMPTTFSLYPCANASHIEAFRFDIIIQARE